MAEPQMTGGWHCCAAAAPLRVLTQASAEDHSRALEQCRYNYIWLFTNKIRALTTLIA
jgi:hypothetical protein